MFPPRKIKRPNEPTASASQNNCGCASVLERIEAKLDVVLSKINTLQAENTLIQSQLAQVVESIVEQTAAVDSLRIQQYEGHEVAKQFPVRSPDALIAMDEAIDSSNRALYINVIRSILQPDGVLKNLKHILSDNVTMAYNVDGIAGKASLKSLSQFFECLIDAIAIDVGVGAADDHLRRAIQLQKKRVFKSKSYVSIHALNRNIKVEEIEVENESELILG